MPDTIVELCEVIDSADSQSSLMKKAPPAMRRRLVGALIRREPYTYREVFNNFELDPLGISFTAFYYWARKVRRSAALIEMARSCSPEENPAELLPKVLAQRLLDASLDEDINMNALSRMAQIYQMTSYIEFARRRLDHQIAAGARIPSRTPPGGNPIPNIAPSEPAAPVAAGTPAGREIGANAATRKTAPEPACRPALDAAQRCQGSADSHSKFRVPTSAFSVNLKSPPDPRREALRRRLRENYKPLVSPDTP